jgi:hypothetical protein
MSGEFLGITRNKTSSVSREICTECSAGVLGSKGSVGLARVESGYSHHPWSKCIEGTREMEILTKKEDVQRRDVYLLKAFTYLIQYL